MYNTELEITNAIQYNDELIENQTQENLKDLDNVYKILQMKAHFGLNHLGNKVNITPDFNPYYSLKNWFKMIRNIQSERNGRFDISLLFAELDNK